MRRRHWRFCSRALWAVVASAAAGCYGGDGLPRQPVSGSVKLNGKPLQNGIITFYPAQRMLEGTLVVGGDMVKNGRFAIARREGLIPGKYKVGVYSGNKMHASREAEREPGNDAVVPKESIPTKYNSDTRLEIEISNHGIKEIKLELVSD
jgi:hypothetical protein